MFMLYYFCAIKMLFKHVGSLVINSHFFYWYKQKHITQIHKIQMQQIHNRLEAMESKLKYKFLF